MQTSMFPDELSVRERKVEYEVKRIEALESSYENVYWFARALVGSEYDSEGSNTKNMLNLR